MTMKEDERDASCISRERVTMALNPGITGRLHTHERRSSVLSPEPDSCPQT
jgi:hypothetical protein